MYRINHYYHFTFTDHLPERTAITQEPQLLEQKVYHYWVYELENGKYN